MLCSWQTKHESSSNKSTISKSTPSKIQITTQWITCNKHSWKFHYRQYNFVPLPVKIRPTVVAVDRKIRTLSYQTNTMLKNSNLKCWNVTVSWHVHVAVAYTKWRSHFYQVASNNKCKYHSKDTAVDGVEPEYCPCPKFVGFLSSDVWMSQTYLLGQPSQYTCTKVLWWTSQQAQSFRHNCMPSCFMLQKLDFKF